MPRVKGWKDPNHIKANVMYLCTLNGYTIEKMAKSVGIDKSNLYRHLDRPNNIKLGMLEKISKFLGCTVEELISKKKPN